MAWERNGNCRFFTLSGTVNGRVTRTYYGVGLIGEMAEAVVAMRRKNRQAASAARRANQQNWEAAIETLQRSIKSLNRLVAISLLTAGYRQHHRGDWKTTHHAQSDPPT